MPKPGGSGSNPSLKHCLLLCNQTRHPLNRRQNSSNGKNLGRAEDGLHDNAGDLVGVGVGGGPPVLEVTALLHGTLARNTDGGTAVGDTIRELLDAASLVTASETLLVALTVDGDVLLVAALCGI